SEERFPAFLELNAVRYKGVSLSLLAKGRHRTMPWNESNLRTQRPQVLSNGADQVVEVALWKVRAANGAGEQDITHHRQLAFRVIEHHMSRCVAGTMINL